MEDTLQKLREKIDAIDSEIFQNIQQRLTLIEQIGEEKKKLNKPITDEEREKEKLLSLEEKAKILNVPFAYIKNIWENLFAMSKQLQK